AERPVHRLAHARAASSRRAAAARGAPGGGRRLGEPRRARPRERARDRRRARRAGRRAPRCRAHADARGRRRPRAPHPRGTVLARGFELLETAADPALARLRTLWRPRALVLLGRADELAREDGLRLKLEDRLAAISRQMDDARAAGDDDAAEAAHARYIELGT